MANLFGSTDPYGTWEKAGWIKSSINVGPYGKSMIGPEGAGLYQSGWFKPAKPAPSAMPLGGGGVGGGGGEEPRREAPRGEYKETRKAQERVEQFPFEELVAPAIKSLEEFGRTLEEALPTQLAEIGRGGEAIVGELKGERARREQEYGRQAGRAGTAAETAVSEARRGFSEIQRGIQSLYGGTTGTGAFATELAGRETLRGIGLTRRALQTTLSDIDVAVGNVKSETTRRITSERERVELAKESARNELRRAIAEIGMRKGELEARKGEARLQALKEARDLISGIESERVAFERQLYMQGEQARLSLEEMKARATQNYQIQLQRAQQMTPVYGYGSEGLTEWGEVPAGAQILRMPTGEEEEDEEWEWTED